MPLTQYPYVEAGTFGLDLAHLRRMNVDRAVTWHAGAEPWSGADWSNAMCGEAGEAANVVKKIRRRETGIQPMDDVIKYFNQLGSELADVVTYADLVAAHYGLPDLGSLVVVKFNEVSEKRDLPHRL